jgi:hypothetical protein
MPLLLLLLLLLLLPPGLADPTGPPLQVTQAVVRHAHVSLCQLVWVQRGIIWAEEHDSADAMLLLPCVNSCMSCNDGVVIMGSAPEAVLMDFFLRMCLQVWRGEASGHDPPPHCAGPVVCRPGGRR